MYRIKIVKRKYSKNNALGLFNENGEVATVVIEDKPTKIDLLRLQVKTGLSIDWEAIWSRFQRKVFGKYCENCGRYFETKVQNQKYCSEQCKKEAKKRNEQEYYKNNRLKILKKATEKRRFKQKQNDNIIRETLQNVGYLPEGFNQIDNHKKLGEGNLVKHRDPDFEKEQELVKKELKRLLHR